MKQTITPKRVLVANSADFHLALNPQQGSGNDIRPKLTSQKNRGR